MKKMLYYMGIILALTACGKKGPLVSPDALAPGPIADLKVRQTGSRFLLCLSPPSRDEAKRPLKDLAGVRVFRREVLPPSEDCEECPTAYRLLRTIDLEYPDDILRFGSLYCLADAELVPGNTYQYKAVSFQRDGTMSDDSNKVRRKLVTPPVAPVLKVVSAESGVVLEWTGSPLSGQGVLAGFNIYRGRAQGDVPFDPFITMPAAVTRYEDKSLELGGKYFYVVKAVARVDGELIESEPSNSVFGELKLPED
jgi:predicted small lipoprotein YifL